MPGKLREKARRTQWEVWEVWHDNNNSLPLRAYYVPGTVWNILHEAVHFLLPTILWGGYHCHFCFADAETAQRGITYWRAIKVKGTEGEHGGKGSWKHITESFEWIWIEPARSPGAHARLYQFICNVLETKGFSILGRGPTAMCINPFCLHHVCATQQGQTSVGIWIKTSLSKWWHKGFPNEFQT